MIYSTFSPGQSPFRQIRHNQHPANQSPIMHKINIIITTRETIYAYALSSAALTYPPVYHPHPEPPTKLVDHCRLVSGVVRMRLWRGSGSMWLPDIPHYAVLERYAEHLNMTDRPITNNGSWCGMISCPPGSEWFC